MGSFDLGLLAAVTSTLINSVTLVFVRAYSKNLKDDAKGIRRVPVPAQTFWNSNPVSPPILTFEKCVDEERSQTSQQFLNSVPHEDGQMETVV